MSTQPREFDKVDRALELQVIDWLQWGEFPDRLDRPSMPALALELIAKRKLAFASLETENLRLSDELNFFKSCATAQALKIASREEELEQAKAYIHEYRIKRGDTVESMVLEIRSLKEIAENCRIKALDARNFLNGHLGRTAVNFDDPNEWIIKALYSLTDIIYPPLDGEKK